MGKRLARRNPTTGAVNYYLSDRLGSARVITDANGNIVDESDYYPYGGERMITGSSADNTYKFTGHERDAESGLDHTLNRQYSSNTGRWLSPDPHGGDIREPQTWNRYTYVKGGPTNFTDPQGADLYCGEFWGSDETSGCKNWYDDTDPIICIGPCGHFILDPVTRALMNIERNDYWKSLQIGAENGPNGTYTLILSPDLYSVLLANHVIDPASVAIEVGIYYTITVTAAWIVANQDIIKGLLGWLKDKIKGEPDVCKELYDSQEAECKQIPTQPEQNNCIKVALDNLELCRQSLPPLPLPIPGH